VESWHEELLKELQFLEDQRKALSCQMMANEALLQVIEREVFDLQSLIDTLNAGEVIDPATKASLENTKTYVKELFEDVKTF